MSEGHATLSPSAAERWLECPASVRMETIVPAESESIYAREGTAAHELGEIKASLQFGMITEGQFYIRMEKWRLAFKDLLNDEVEAEMERHTDAYVALLRERMGRYPYSQLLLEQRLPTYLPDGGKGTSDAVIMSPQHVEIVDFKYGQGVEVNAENNPQLRLYAFGALMVYGGILGETEDVRMTVHQPRLNHILTEQLPAQELRDWHKDILPIAVEALSDNAHFSPSDTACRWCPASGRCQAQLEAVFSEDFEAKPDRLTPEQMSEVLDRLPLVREWLKAFEEAALSTIYSEGIPIPNWKVVMSGGKRAVRDNELAIKVLKEAGYSDEDVSRTTPKTLGDLEKLLGPEKLKELLEDPGIVTKGDGKPSLVPEDDRRPAIEPNQEASKVFGEELL